MDKKYENSLNFRCTEISVQNEIDKPTLTINLLTFIYKMEFVWGGGAQGVLGTALFLFIFDDLWSFCENKNYINS